MKFGLIAATMLAVVAVPATAQTVVTRTTTVHREKHVGGPVIVKHRRKVCTVRWDRRHHHKIRRCTWR